ncbi:hypothetical protein [Herbidospora mongoliensis]|uniref:hypothetical protein n=1 Tax=Herbidospora mongoliensis TaxID=688067 RepID=UPI000831ED4A|nr:hypothetical protein [Herbidospora mongoliensis]
MTESPATVHHVTVDYEWALEGKPPGSYNDYEVLSHSGGLDLGIFDEIRSRYATGASGDRPEVTIAFAGTRQPDGQDVYYIVLALQNEWSGHRDGTNRKIFYTRWYYVPYEQLAGHRVSYEALYDAFKDLGDTRPTTIAVRAYADLPEKMYRDAVSAAGLLMTGKHVCVVGADEVSMLKRLRFIDEVAALLPYGMRTRLTAATWVSATADHKIRLSFAPHAADGTYKVVWTHGAELPAGERAADAYVRLLHDPRVTPGELVERLAQKIAQLSFTPNGILKARNVLEDCTEPERIRRELVAAEPPVEEDEPPRLPPLPSPSSQPTQILPAGGDAGSTVAMRSPLLLERLIGSLKNAGSGTEATSRLAALREAVDHDEARLQLQKAMLRFYCFKDAIDSSDHPRKDYTALAEAAFTVNTCRTETADALLQSGDTPRPVKKVIRGMRDERAWWRPALPGNAAKLVSGLAVLAVGGALFAFAAAGFFSGSDDPASPPGETATAGVPAVPPTVVVQADQADRYLADIYARLVHNLGQPAEVQNVGTLDPAQPQIVITTDVGRYPGYRPLLSTQSIRMTLVVNSDKIQSSELEDALEKGTKSVAVREDFADEARLKDRFTDIELVRMPEATILDALKKGDVSIAIMPSDLPGVTSPVEQSSLLDDVLPPQRSIQVLSSGLSTATWTSLGGVSDTLAEKWRAGPGGPDRQEKAREFADSLVPPVVVSAQPAPLKVTPGSAVYEPVSLSSFINGVLLFVAALIILIAGMIILFRSPSRAPDDRRR